MGNWLDFSWLVDAITYWLIRFLTDGIFGVNSVLLGSARITLILRTYLLGISSVIIGNFYNGMTPLYAMGMMIAILLAGGFIMVRWLVNYSITTVERLFTVLLVCTLMTGSAPAIITGYDTFRQMISEITYTVAFSAINDSDIPLSGADTSMCNLSAEDGPGCIGYELALWYLHVENEEDLVSLIAPDTFKLRYFSIDGVNIVEPPDIAEMSADQRAALMATAYEAPMRAMQGLPISVMALLEQLIWAMFTFTTLGLFIALSVALIFSAFVPAGNLLSTISQQMIQLLITSGMAGVLMGIAMGLMLMSVNNILFLIGSSLLAVIVYAGLFIQMQGVMTQSFNTIANGVVATGASTATSWMRERIGAQKTDQQRKEAERRREEDQQERKRANSPANLFLRSFATAAGYGIAGEAVRGLMGESQLLGQSPKFTGATRSDSSTPGGTSPSPVNMNKAATPISGAIPLSSSPANTMKASQAQNEVAQVTGVSGNSQSQSDKAKAVATPPTLPVVTPTVASIGGQSLTEAPTTPDKPSDQPGRVGIPDPAALVLNAPTIPSAPAAEIPSPNTGASTTETSSDRQDDQFGRVGIPDPAALVLNTPTTPSAPAAEILSPNTGATSATGGNGNSKNWTEAAREAYTTTSDPAQAWQTAAGKPLSLEVAQQFNDFVYRARAAYIKPHEFTQIVGYLDQNKRTSAESLIRSQAFGYNRFEDGDAAKEFLNVGEQVARTLRQTSEKSEVIP